MAGKQEGILAGKGYVSLYVDDTALVKGLRRAEDTVKSFGAKVGNIGSSFIAAGAAIAGIGAAMGTPFVHAIMLASDAAETANKFEAVFGDQAAAAQQFVNALGSTIGRGRTEIQNGMSSIQAFLVGLDFDPTAARNMSQEVTALAYDLGSFANIADDEALTRMLGGLSGEAENLKRFGINLLQSSVDAKLAQMGITGVATEAQKVSARMAIIRESMARQGATGDAERTAGGFANTLKRAKAQFMDFAISVGTVLLPIATTAVNRFASAMTWLAASVQRNQNVIKTVAAIAAALVAAGASFVAIGVVFKSVGALIYWIGNGFGILASTISAVWSLALFLLTPMGALTVALAAAAAAVIYFSDSQTALSSFGVDFGNEFMAVISSIVDALASGQFGMAAQIGLAGIRLQFSRIGTTIFAVFTQVVDDFIDLWRTAFRAVMNMWGALGEFVANIMNTVIVETLVAWERVQNVVNPLRTQEETDANIARHINDGQLRTIGIQLFRQQFLRTAMAALPQGSNGQAARDVIAEGDAEQRRLQGELDFMRAELDVDRILREMSSGAAPALLASTTGEVLNRVSSSGTFDAAAAGMVFGGNDPMTQVERNTREQNRLTQQMLDWFVRQQGLVVV